MPHAKKLPILDGSSLYGVGIYSNKASKIGCFVASKNVRQKIGCFSHKIRYYIALIVPKLDVCHPKLDITLCSKLGCFMSILDYIALIMFQNWMFHVISKNGSHVLYHPDINLILDVLCHKKSPKLNVLYHPKITLYQLLPNFGVIL